MSELRIPIFSPEFLSLTSRRDPSPTSTPEATWAGPWHVERHGEAYAVGRIRGGEPEALASFRETALLLAAVFPSCGRGQFYWLGEPEPEESGVHPVTLRTVLGERGLVPVGRLRRRSEELLVPLSTAEYFLRSPAALSYLLEAAPVETLHQAGAELMQRLLADPRAEPGRCRGKETGSC